METVAAPSIPAPLSERTFNFLASLINGNNLFLAKKQSKRQSFNFLASLINGNEFYLIKGIGLVLFPLGASHLCNEY
jgi:hypothetical protein